MIDLGAQIQQQAQGSATRVGTVHSTTGASLTIEDDGSIVASTANGMGLRVDATTGVVSLVGSDIQQWCTSLEIQGSQGSTAVLNDDHIEITQYVSDDNFTAANITPNSQHGSFQELNEDHIQLTEWHGASLTLDATHLIASYGGSKIELMPDGQTLTVCNSQGMGLFVTQSTTTVVGPQNTQTVLSYDETDGRVITMDCDKFDSSGTIVTPDATIGGIDFDSHIHNVTTIGQSGPPQS
jgi:hypothetical protein